MARNIEDVYGLAPIQQGLLYEQMHQPGSGVYVEQLTLTFDGPVRPELFGRAWQAVLDRHPILRTSFHWHDDGEPLQVVHRHLELPLDLQDWRDQPVDEQERRYRAWLTRERAEGFDLTKPPLMRVALIRRDLRTWTFAWRFSHLLMDGWSFGLAIQDFFAYYRAFYHGTQPDLPPAMPYREYVGWWHKQNGETAEKFWRAELDGFGPTGSLGWAPEDVDTGRGMGVHDYVHLTLGPFAAELQQFAQAHQLTLPTITQAAWVLLLARHLGTDDLVTGVTIAHRPPDLPGASGILGPMIVTLPVRARLDPGEPLCSWLSRFQAEQAVLREEWRLPLVDIQRLANLPMPLLQTTVSYENVPMPDFGLDDVDLSLVDAVYDGRTHYPITMVIMPGDDMPLRIMYDLRSFGREAGQTIARQLGAMLEQMVRNPGARLAELDPRTETERAAFAGRIAEPLIEPPDGTLHERFARWVARQPEATAVVDESTELTYWQLDQTASWVAHLLQSRGVGKGTLVGLCVPRSAALIVGVLAILKAGAAYVPLDPDYPPKRLRYLVADSGISVVVAGRDTEDLVRGLGCEVVMADEESTNEALADSAPNVATTGEDLAYVLYTSGSTGHPKGARITHTGVLGLMAAACQEFGFDQDDVWTLCHSYAFDYTVWEMWGALLHGGRLVVTPRWVTMTPSALHELVIREKVTVFSQTPAAFEQFAGVDTTGEGLSLRYVFLGADRLDPRTLASWVREHDLTDIAVVNLYGVTETSVVNTFHRITADEVHHGDGASIIGNRLANQRLYVLDPYGTPVAAGVPGELHISGHAVGRGYHGRDELTAQRFVPDPFVPGATMYRTGDLVRSRPDEALEYWGRIDKQVKVRGFRIEPGEIETVLRAHPAVRTACVTVDSDAPTGPRVVAHVVPVSSRVSELELLVHLRERLPAHMVPAAIGWLDAIPLTPNGKIDYAVLPALQSADHGATAYVAARTGLEQAVADILANLLEQEWIGVFDDLGQLGLHSVIAMRLAVYLRLTFGIELPVETLLVNPTVARICETLRREGVSNGTGIDVVDAR